MAGEGDGLDGRILLAQMAHQIKAVAVQKRQVADQQVKMILIGLLPCLGQSRGHIHGVSHRLEQPRQGTRTVGVVLYHQNVAFG
jgi:hypothetical protein